VAAKRQNSTRRAGPRAVQSAVNNGWRSRVHMPAETDPKKRAEAIDRAASRIKTTACIDTVTLGRH
jgi:hypothetical protein